MNCEPSRMFSTGKRKQHLFGRKPQAIIKTLLPDEPLHALLMRYASPPAPLATIKPASPADGKAREAIRAPSDPDEQMLLLEKRIARFRQALESHVHNPSTGEPYMPASPAPVKNQDTAPQKAGPRLTPCPHGKDGCVLNNTDPDSECRHEGVCFPAGHKVKEER